MKTRRKKNNPTVLNLFRMALHGNAFVLYKHKDFHDLLARERALSDRHNRLFSLVEFNMTENRPNPAESQALLDVLEKRLRKSDIAGWIGPWRVGVILPDTPSCGAWVLTERVCREVSDRMARPACKVCTYPTEEKQPLAAPATTVPLLLLPTPDQAVRPGSEPGLVTGILFGRPPFWKRVLDVMGGVTALILLSPLMLLVAVTIKMVSKGPILFRQERIGYLGEPFVCWKFRTMRVNADVQIHKAYFQSLMQTDTAMIKLEQKEADPRLIPFGKYLRASGVDELPQLFNVIRGDMSLVGPRPSIRYEYDGYQRWQKNRCDTLPGLTGLWQTSGKNKTTFTEMMRLDISYARRKSLAVDLLMLIKTVPAVWGEVRSTMRVNRRRSCKTFSTSES